MPGLIIRGKEYDVPSLTIDNYNDTEALRRGNEDGALRNTSWVRQVIIHTTKGIPGGSNRVPQTVNPGAGPGGESFKVNSFWTNSNKQSGAHLIINSDGTVGCVADLAVEKMYHAGNRAVNDTSIGIEIFQLSDGSIYEASLESCVKLCEFLASHFGIQKQIHLPYNNGPVFRLEQGGSDCVGFFGHRDVSNNRGLGDPGDIVMECLLNTGFEAFDFSKSEDLDVWKKRQAEMGITTDGIPGPKTVATLLENGYPSGLWDEAASFFSEEEVRALVDAAQESVVSHVKAVFDQLKKNLECSEGEAE